LANRSDRSPGVNSSVLTVAKLVSGIAERFVTRL